MRYPFAALVVLSLATPALAQDPVKVDPKHHKVEIDNDQVRVLRITFAPGDKTPAHDHPASVAIFLTDAKNRVSPVGGAVNEDPRKRGDVVLLEGGKHTVENIGTTPVEVVLVELKTQPAAGSKGPARDAVKLDPKHYTVVGENDRVRVLRISYGPGEQSVLHDHPPNVIAALSDGQFKMKTEDGTSADATVKRGTVQYAGSESHQPQNASSARFEGILVELKGVAGAAGSKR